MNNKLTSNSTGAYRLRSLEHCDNGFEPRSRHCCVHLSLLCCATVGRDLVMCQSTFQGVLTKCLKGFIASGVNSDS
jgi:hypothetical protein